MFLRLAGVVGGQCAESLLCSGVCYIMYVVLCHYLHCVCSKCMYFSLYKVNSFCYDLVLD